ncbi:hypothetical protein BHM03_00016305 [Ensete ventricosum]|nr:hypothetical protein BHM03_00016305 [Ensete ventricosum]
MRGHRLRCLCCTRLPPRAAVACAASVARGCLRVRPPLARPLLHAAAFACDRRLMQLPLHSIDPTSAWAVGSVVDAADLYAHSVIQQVYHHMLLRVGCMMGELDGVEGERGVACRAHTHTNSSRRDEVGAILRTGFGHACSSRRRN